MISPLLLAIDSADRLSAIDDHDPTDPEAMFAVRDLALGDEDATVRAYATTFLGRSRCKSIIVSESISGAIGDALFDTHPSVRMAAAIAIAKQRARHFGPTLTRMALEEPIWWVRRAAILSLARLLRKEAIGTLRGALDDPFWRVRHAAVRALLDLEIDLADLALGSDAENRSERADAALHYLARRLSPSDVAPLISTTTTTQPQQHQGNLYDPDPAVIAARLEHGKVRETPAELALYLGDAHEALRRAASERLASIGDLRALEVASLWLEEPRIPHATRAVVELLDRLGPEVLELLSFAFANLTTRPGLAAWAISYVANADLEDEYAPSLFEASASDQPPLVRRVAIAALGKFLRSDDEEQYAAHARSILERALGDDDDDVRRLAIHALIAADPLDDTALRTRRGMGEEPALVRRLLVSITKDEADLLKLAADDPDPATKAHALKTLHHFGCVPVDRLHQARHDADPWIRAAVLDDESALDVLANDPDPRLKRAAFDVAARNNLANEAARIAHRDSDPWLRTRAAERLARSKEESDLLLVLRLSRDPELSVRAAAADVIDRSRLDLNERLLRLTDQKDLDPTLREAAETWLGLRAPQIIARHIHAPPLATIEPPKKQSEKRPATPSTARLLARGMSIAPLVLSGANEPSVASLFRAIDHANANAVFWEPRYRNLSAFLRRTAEARNRPLVIAGTYHATARAIRKDVEQTLRRLGRDAIDVFLVFWVRSPARLHDEVPETMERLRREGLVRSIGFSTHDRDLALNHARAPWDVMMIRHSAAHPGAEGRLFPAAHKAGIGVLGFSATSYGRLLEPKIEGIAPPTAAECYRYSLAQPGVTACISAPRGGRELIENLAVLAEPDLSADRLRELRVHGEAVRKESLDWSSHIRRFPATPPEFESAIHTNVEAEAALEVEAGRDLPFDA